MKKIYLVTILTFLSWNLYSQIVWTKDVNNPVLTQDPGSWEDSYVSPSAVLSIGDTYHMWYSGGQFPALGGDLGVGLATSPDGIEWTKDTMNPILDLGIEGEWDDKGVFKPSVIYTGSIYHMWYSGYTTDGNFRGIGHAISMDAVTWEKDINNPVIKVGASGEWDRDRVAAPTVVHDGDQFHMWYAGPSNSGIGHATSPDGTVWTKDAGNPVLSRGASYDWDYPDVDYPDVVFEKDTFRMFYAGGKFLEWDRGYATSIDGSTWTKSDYNPVLRRGPDSGDWDFSYISMSPVMIDEDANIYKMWYAGGRLNGRGIGYATSNIGEVPEGVGNERVLIQSAAEIYPNPAEDLITIKMNTIAEHTLEIVSINGQLIYTAVKSEPSYTIDLSSFDKGVYFIKIRSQNSAITRKAIKL